jgi:hypothetical protein
MQGSTARFGVALAAVVAGTILIGAGCDDRPTPPPPAAQRNADGSQTDPSAPPRPTTQELVAGPYKHLQLAPLPLTADVPQSWEVENNTLKGPIPYSPHDLIIQLTSWRRQSGDRFDRMLNYAKKDAEARHVTHFDVRDGSGGMKIIEEQTAAESAGVTSEPASTQPGMPLMSWKLLFYVPRGGDFDVYDLNFINLDNDTFEKNKPMLRKIVDSVTSDPTAPSPIPAAPDSIVPAPPAPPAR